MTRSEFYVSEKWKRKRLAILKRDGYIDQIEKRYGKTKEATIVHHIFPLAEYPEYRMSDWNLISVSMGTHNRLHDRETDELTDMGVELLIRTARKNNIPLPYRYTVDRG